MSKTAGPNEPRRRGHVLPVASFVAGLLAYEGLVHWAAVSGHTGSLGPLLAFMPIVLPLCWLLWRQWRIGGLLVAAAVIFAVLRVRELWPDLKLLYPVPHALVYLLLLWFFGRTLRAGREPLVTLIARHEHGGLPPDIELYTRHVTWAWCVFFFVMMATSLVLFTWAPLPIWSWFANVLNVPVILLMFVAEYIYRVLRYPNFSHASFFTAIRAFRDLGRAAVAQGR